MSSNKRIFPCKGDLVKLNENGERFFDSFLKSIDYDYSVNNNNSEYDSMLKDYPKKGELGIALSSTMINDNSFDHNDEIVIFWFKYQIKLIMLTNEVEIVE